MRQRRACWLLLGVLLLLVGAVLEGHGGLVEGVALAEGGVEAGQAHRLGASRHAVREALKRLQSVLANIETMRTSVRQAASAMTVVRSASGTSTAIRRAWTSTTSRSPSPSGSHTRSARTDRAA